ncbi:Phenoloxidase-activating factor 2-like 11 [Homarus americanus]|uniref:Phenoloxidase-activating factor 2-like 11 n=1 Tax=Homarus americanus TaxID=6706 RepID=A0A8J5TI17_HOMAM|nr:Phenoloxidase-activating factor 2-like 11 [Homarus americanus]
MATLVVLTATCAQEWSWGSSNAAALEAGRSPRVTGLREQLPVLVSSEGGVSEMEETEPRSFGLCRLGVGVNCPSRPADAAPPSERVERPHLAHPHLRPSPPHTGAPQLTPTTVQQHIHIHTHAHHNQETQDEVNPTQVTSQLPAYREDCRCMIASHCSAHDVVSRRSPDDYNGLIVPRSRSVKIISNSSDDAIPSKPSRKQEEDYTSSRGGSVRVRRDSFPSATTQGREGDGYLPGEGGCEAGLVCCRSPHIPRPLHELICGRRHSQGVLARIKNPHFVKGNTKFGEYPWQAAILKADEGEVVYVCGAALTDHRHVVTAAHCVSRLQASQLRVRLGEWDVRTHTEFYGHLELLVAAVHTHPHFYAGNLHNDIAVITLQITVDFSAFPHISPVCLPDSYSSFVGQRCHSTGWGKDAFGSEGKYQTILQEVEVPVLDHNNCQEALRHTRLGPDFTLHPGMVCAGGEGGRDACTGDGGGPLVCSGPEGRFQLAGLVSWGVGCGQPGVPGVYVDVAYYLEWLLATSGLI